MKKLGRTIFFAIAAATIFGLAACNAEVHVAQQATTAHANAGAQNPPHLEESARSPLPAMAVGAAAPAEIAEVAEVAGAEEAEAPEAAAVLGAVEAFETVETVAAAQTFAGPRNIPIFMYHTSSEDNPGSLAELYVRPSEFERQIRHLYENGYTFVTFDDWFGLHAIERPVFITFDDGYLANYTEIFPILQRYNARITIFLTLDNMAREGLTAEMIRTMSDSGLVKFEAHTITHVDLASVSANDERLTRELRDARDMIEEITGKSVLAVAYPGGRFNARVIERAREYYLFGVSTIQGLHSTGLHDDFEMRRLRVNRSTSLNAFINMLGHR